MWIVYVSILGDFKRFKKKQKIKTNSSRETPTRFQMELQSAENQVSSQLR